jgi:hypothetical protein
MADMAAVYVVVPYILELSVGFVRGGEGRDLHGEDEEEGYC